MDSFDDRKDDDHLRIRFLIQKLRYLGLSCLKGHKSSFFEGIVPISYAPTRFPTVSSYYAVILSIFNQSLQTILAS